MAAHLEPPTYWAFPGSGVSSLSPRIANAGPSRFIAHWAYAM